MSTIGESGRVPQTAGQASLQPENTISSEEADFEAGVLAFSGESRLQLPEPGPLLIDLLPRTPPSTSKAAMS